MTYTTMTNRRRALPVVSQLNSRWHRAALLTFLAIVVAHWVEHVVQSIQIWIFDWPRPEARGLLGMVFPVLIADEWLHWGYAVVMLIGLALLRPGMVGRARAWWTVALVVQVWHFVEHSILFWQAFTDTPWFGRADPTSVLQVLYQRAELHLWYNGIVFVPMVIAMVIHMFPSPRDRTVTHEPRCHCATQSYLRRVPVI